jgi:SAM-dependent methyltransferase
VSTSLIHGSLLGVDRSAKAVAAARQRNHDAVAQGRLAFRRLAFEDIDPAEVGRYDTVFAVNVNLFWTRPAQHELRLVAALLRPRGHLWLFYDPPTTEGVDRLRGLLHPRLDQAGYDHRTGTVAAGDTTLFTVTARPLASSAEGR